MSSSADQLPPELPAADPAGQAATTYRERMAALEQVERRLQREHIQLGYLRLVFGLALVILLLPPKVWALLPFFCFALAARIHQGVLQRLAETRRALAFYGHGLARIGDRWAGLRPRPTRLDTSTSLYASDLDLFGAGSLFEMLCDARTSLGEDTLAAWLLAPGAFSEVRKRQEAVADLRSRVALREAFAAAPGPAVAILNRQTLGEWAVTSGPPLPRTLQWIAPLLVLLTLAGAWRFAVAHTPVSLSLMLLVDVCLTFAYKRGFQALFMEAEQASRALRTLGALLSHLERESFAAEELLQAKSVFQQEGRSASAALQELARLVQWSEARSNYVVRVLDAPGLYSVQLALLVQRWKQRFGTQLRPWLDALGRCEALLSLSGYSFEHPGDPFPHLTEETVAFSAKNLGHPLLPEARCVRNDVSLGGGTQLLLVSGSNMSGKSTLLRSVGINAVLAFAGAPVRAQSLSVSVLRIAASIQVSDSLQAGRSRFYAEILRLRAITKAARTHGPVLFLIDEVLAGTNSNDRLAGAHGLVNDLLRHEAIGLLSTHDLALTAVSPDHVQAIRNVHFEDEVRDGQLYFAYKLQDGVVTRSNGLALMRLIGLDV